MQRNVYTRSLLCDDHADYRFVVPKGALRAFRSRLSDDAFDVTVYVRREVDPCLRICMDVHDVLRLNTGLGKNPIICVRVLSVNHARSGRRADLEVEPC